MLCTGSRTLFGYFVTAVLLASPAILMSGVKHTPHSQNAAPRNNCPLNHLTKAVQSIPLLPIQWCSEHIARTVESLNITHCPIPAESRKGSTPNDDQPSPTDNPGNRTILAANGTDPLPTPHQQIPSGQEPRWLTNYAEAMARAENQRKMLLIYFRDGDGMGARFKSETLDAPSVCEKLREYVCLELPLTAKILIRGQEVALLEHEAFQEMQGKPGIAVIDFRTNDPKLHGSVVSLFPITEKLWYTPEQMAVILDLPPGTLTQRTLIYAVRTHPEKPASADSEPLPTLFEEAQEHSEYQARIRNQGHHFWNTRFQRIIARLPGGLTAREVCAESWPGENLVEAAVECVRCWRASSGHWSAVRGSSRFFGYDMKRGSNGIWYATGILGLR